VLYIDEVPLTIKRFPNGEVRIPAFQPAFSSSNPDGATIRIAYESDADLLHLLFVVRHLEEIGAPTPSLLIDYMPYSRMDRATEDVFTLPTVANLINSMNFSKVEITEPHSDVTPALIHRATTASPSSTWLLSAALAAVEFDPARDLLLFPDAGAQKRYGDLTEKYQYMVGLKHRDHGKLSNFQLVGPDAIAPGAQVVIVDDLSSYGNTFLALAKLVEERYGPRLVYLVVTHAEPSVYVGTLLTDGVIDGVFTTSSLQPASKNPALHLYHVRTHQPVVPTTNKGESNA
jgi:ribose-phosphate pyrophosphokinase